MKSETLPGIWLTDSSVFIFKAWFGWPDNFHTAQGDPVNAVVGYLSTLVSWLEVQQPDYWVCAFDHSLFSGFRHELDSEYKANRALPDEALAFQLKMCETVSELLGARCLASHEFEADDLIASARAKWFQESPVTVLSSDKDLAQLMKPQDILWHSRQKPAMDQVSLEAKWQVKAHQIPDFLALMGDASDNIPGVPGIGAKTAAALLTRYHNLETLFNSLDQLSDSGIRGAKSLLSRLEEHKTRVELNLQLTQLRVDVKIGKKPAPWTNKRIKHQQLMELCTDLNFPKNLKARIERLTQ